jgi:hypothetical protein
LINEFFALLGTRVSGIVDLKMPIAADSSEVLITVELKQGANEAESKAIADRVAATIRKAFANDPSAERVEVEGLEAWRLTFKEDVAPGAGQNDPNVVNGQRIIATALVTVWNGHLVIAGDPTILKKVITRGPQQPGLAVAADYVAVTAELGKLIPVQIPTPVSLGYVRLDEFIRVDYELARAGKLKQGRTLLGRALEALLRDADGNPIELKLDGAKLPPFANIQKHLSPFGLLISNVPDGVFIVGFSYEQAPPGPQRAGAAPAEQTPADATPSK